PAREGQSTAANIADGSVRVRPFLRVCILLASAVLTASCSGYGSPSRSRSSQSTATPVPTEGSTASTSPPPGSPTSAAPQGPRLQGYLSVRPFELIYLEWTQRGDKLNGTYNVLRLSSSHQV